MNNLPHCSYTVPEPMHAGASATASDQSIDLLVSHGLLSGSALERTRRLQAESGDRIDRIAAKLGLISDAHLAAAYAELLGSPVIPAAEFPAEPIAADRLRKTFLHHARAIPSPRRKPP